MRITPEEINKLKPHQVFVFGSNLSGRHGKGAAKTARNKFGAQQSNPEGLQGSSYALPTVNYYITKPLELDVIRIHVDKFIAFAKSHPELDFLVTPVGCGLAGYQPYQIAPFFKECLEVENIWLPEVFLTNLNKQNNEQNNSR